MIKMVEIGDEISFGDHYWIIFANPDEGSYNYTLIPYTSRWGNYSKEQEIPAEIVEVVMNKSSNYYPIMIVNGRDLDSLIDKIAMKKTHIEPHKFWGNLPRWIKNRPDEEHVDSVPAFEEDQGSNEAIKRKAEARIKELQDKANQASQSMSWHDKQKAARDIEKDGYYKEITAIMKKMGWDDES